MRKKEDHERKLGRKKSLKKADYCGEKESDQKVNGRKT